MRPLLLEIARHLLIEVITACVHARFTDVVSWTSVDEIKLVSMTYENGNTLLLNHMKMIAFSSFVALTQAGSA